MKQLVLEISAQPHQGPGDVQGKDLSLFVPCFPSLPSSPLCFPTPTSLISTVPPTSVPFSSSSVSKSAFPPPKLPSTHYPS